MALEREGEAEFSDSLWYPGPAFEARPRPTALVLWGPPVFPGWAQTPGVLADLAAPGQPTEAQGPRPWESARGLSYLKLDQHRPTFKAILQLFHGSLQSVPTLWTHGENGLWEKLVQLIFGFDISKWVDGCSGQESVCLACVAKLWRSLYPPKLYFWHPNADGYNTFLNDEAHSNNFHQRHYFLLSDSIYVNYTKWHTILVSLWWCLPNVRERERMFLKNAYLLSLFSLTWFICSFKTDTFPGTGARSYVLTMTTPSHGTQSVSNLRLLSGGRFLRKHL